MSQKAYTNSTRRENSPGPNFTMARSKVLPTKSELTSLRRKALDMAYKAGGAHLGATFSCTEIISVLYKNILKYKKGDPQYSERDRLILSKGHGCIAVYYYLAKLGYFPRKELDLYCTSKGILPGHTTLTVPGVEASTGSLGHGLPMAVGMALASKLDKKRWRAFVVLSDGDMQEGSTWEAVMSAGHFKLDSLIGIVDFNNLNSFQKVTDTFSNFLPIREKFESFGWACDEVDGHNVEEIYKSLIKTPYSKNKPSVLVARTVKGRGVSFMEGSGSWHYRAPNQEEYELAIKELSQNA